MIEISISRELAAEHSGFLAGCAARGHRVQVFGTSLEQRESDAAEPCDSDDQPAAADAGEPEPGA